MFSLAKISRLHVTSWWFQLVWTILSELGSSSEGEMSWKNLKDDHLQLRNVLRKKTMADEGNSNSGHFILLMAEILHQLIGSSSHYLHIHPRWCRISSTNSIIPLLRNWENLEKIISFFSHNTLNTPRPEASNIASPEINPTWKIQAVDVYLWGPRETSQWKNIQGRMK